MRRIVLKIILLTPAFLAGADGDTPEIRPPSVKGVLRFWWRAFHAGNAGMKKQEGELFGAAGENGGRSKVSLRVLGGNGLSSFIDGRPLPRHTFKVKNFDLNILDYLAYGTYGYVRGKGNVFTRQYIKTGYTFELDFRLGEDRFFPQLYETLRYFCWFASLGAKSRNGFGGFRVVRAEGDLDVKEADTLAGLPDRESLLQLQKEPGDALPAYSAFSGSMKLFQTKKTYGTWDECLAALGFAYRDARLSLEKPHQYQKRQYIGAPLVANKQTVSKLDRRAKPYFLRVHRSGSGFTGYVLYLPSQYCPGLQLDRDNNQLNHAAEDKAFISACRAMNTDLSKQLAVIL